MKPFILIFLLLQTVFGQTNDRLNCVSGEISRNGEYCLLTDIHPMGRFTPVSTLGATKVKEFEITNSTVKHLTPDICQTFPNIEKFTASEVAIETLDKDTFKDCQKLREIKVLRNNIKSFEKDLFNRNANLELLYFGINQLTSIPPELFKNLRNLQDLGFASMNFGKFPTGVFNDLTNLKTLWVYHDALLDLDIEDILHSMPQLQKVYLRDNDFECNRLRIILNQLKNRNVVIDKTIWEGNERHRDYQVAYVEGVECIGDHALYQQIYNDRMSVQAEPVGERFDDKLPNGAPVDRQIMLLRDAYEHKMARLETAHKEEMDDLKKQLSIMHQNLDGKMTELMTKMDECRNHHHHGPWNGSNGGNGYHGSKNYMKGGSQM